jgi:transposase
MDAARDVVVIGVDPHKRSVTIETRDAREVLRATGSFPTTTAGYRAMLRYCWQWPTRIWAVEGAGGVGRPLAARLLADGERVLDVPAKLSARVRVLDAGDGRKTDATDAHAVVMAALRDRNQLRELSASEHLVVLRLLADRRDELSRSRAQGLNRLHRLMTELVPGGVPTKKSVPQYQAMLAGVRPRDVVGAHRAAVGRRPARRPSRPGPAPPRSTPPPAPRSATGSPAPATAGSTTSSTSPRSCNCGTTPPAGPTTGASSPPARPPWKP